MNRGEYTSFEIKVGGVYKLVGCLTAAPMSESAETIQTTTRENNGWITELPTNQSYEISLEGLAKKDGVNLPGNMISYFVLREMKRARQIIEYRIINLDGWFVDKGKAIITEIGYTDTAGEFVTFSATLRGFGKPTGQLVNPDATQVAGRNLILGSKKFLDSNSYWLGDFYLSKNLEVGRQYTVTIWTRSVNQNAQATFRIGDAGGDIITLSKISEKKFTAVFTAPRAASKIVLFREPDDGSYYQFEFIKLEKGNNPTPWTPAPEDI